MDHRRTTFAASLLVASVLALLASAYLAWLGLTHGQAAGCGLSSSLDCDAVLASRWARAFGVPVGVFAAPTYLAILALLWPALRRPGGAAMTLLLTLSLAAMLAAVWMIVLQAFVLGEFCLYCLVAHLCGLVVGVSALGLATGGGPERDTTQMRTLLGVNAGIRPTAPIPARRLTAPRLTAAVLLAVAGVAVMATGQALEEEVVPELEEIAFDTPPASEGEATPEPTQTEQEDSLVEAGEEATVNERELTFPRLAEPLLLSEEPCLGDPSAEHVIVELIDYTCRHCRQLHPFVHRAVERYQGQLAVVVLPAPLSSECNPYSQGKSGSRRYSCGYAKLALGVQRYDPTKFAAFHDWLMDGDRPPRLSQAVQRAVGLFGDRFITDTTRKEAALRTIARNCEASKALGGTLPVLLFTDSASSGVPKSAEQLFRLLENKLGLQPPDEATSP